MKGKPTGPSTTEIKLRSDVDRMRREIARLKKEKEAAAAAGAGATDAAAAAPAGAPEDPDVAKRLAELEEARTRLGRLYFQQVEAGRRRTDQLHGILGELGRPFEGDGLRVQLQNMAEAIHRHLGWRLVLVRLRAEGTERLEAVGFAGMRPSVRAELEAEDVPAGEFTSWLRDEFRVSRSYFISHQHAFNQVLPAGHVSDLGARHEGEWHPDDVLLVPLLDTDGAPLGYISVDDPIDRMVPSRDAIELLEVVASHAVAAIGFDRLQRRAEERRRDLQAMAGQVRGGAALKDQFVSAVSREMRTPLAGIRTHVETLIERWSRDLDADRIRHYLQVIQDEAVRLEGLVESALDLGRFDPAQGRLRRETLDLAGVVEEAAAVLLPMAEAADVHLKVAGELADTRVDADRDQVRQLVLHLVGNAVKVTPAGGTVTLHPGGDERSVTLRVQDTGGGIPAAVLESLFDGTQRGSAAPAHAQDPSPGLAACRAIAEAHGGRLEVSSIPGAGTCFTVTLERHAESRVTMNAPEAWSVATGDVLRLAVEMVGEAMSAGVVSLMAVEPDGDLVIRAATGLDPAVVRGTRVRAGTGVAGWVAANRRPVCVRPDADPEVPGSGRATYRTGTFLSVPIEGRPGVMGVLNVTDPHGGRPFRPEDASLLLALVERVAHAWEAASGGDDAIAGETGDALRAVLQHLREGRGQASHRVRLAHAVAREMRLPEEEVRMLGLAAAVHDVGMQAVSAGVLDAAAPLTPHQREAMRRHVEHGVGLLRPLEAVGSLRDVVLSHHEWWDGSGYPRGLAGTDIPAGARALAVVDAFESMTQGRPHRAAMSKHAALNEIVRLAGRQFDPDAVEALERALPKLRWDEATHTADAAPSAGADPGR